MEHCTKLRIAREAKGLTQTQAGELLNMDQDKSADTNKENKTHPQARL